MVCYIDRWSVRIIRTNNRREYFSNILNDFLTQNGIIHHSSCVNNPQQNKLVERNNTLARSHSSINVYNGGS